jgi:hypothetical protein
MRGEFNIDTRFILSIADIPVGFLAVDNLI